MLHPSQEQEVEMENRPYLCPACAKPLIRTIGADGLYWECENCRHRLTSLTILKKISVIPFITRLWREALEAQPGQGKWSLQIQIMDAKLSI